MDTVADSEYFRPFNVKGSSRILSANRPELMTDPNRLWLVESGAVDLFLVRTENGTHVGARHPLFRVNPGELALPIVGLEPPWQVLAAGMPNTQIRHADWRDLKVTPEAVSALSIWLQKTLTATKAETSNGLISEIKIGSQTIDAQQCLRYSGVFARLRLSEGSVMLMGLSELTIHAGEALPIARGFWLTGAETGVAELVEADDSWDTQNLGSNFDSYHRLIARRYLELIRLRSIADEERLANRAKLDGQLLYRSLASMLSILGDGTAGFPEPGADSGLFAACRLVAAELEIDLKRPAENHHSNKEQIQEIARASKIRLREVVLSDRWWLSDNGPLLAFLDQDEIPVALCVNRGVYLLKNPATGTESKVDETLAELLQPIAYFFYRSLPSEPLSGADLYRFARFGLNADMMTVLVVGILGGLLGLLPPVAMGMLVDTIIPGADRIQLTQLTVALIAFGLGNALFSVTRAIAMVRVESRMDASLQAAIWDRILALPVPFFRDFSAGDLAARVMGINTIRQILSGTTSATLIASIFSLFNLAMMFYYSWELALTGCLLVLVGAIITVVVGYYSLQFQRRIAGIQGKLAGTVLQLIKAVPKLRGSGGERRAFARWAERFTEQRRLIYQARKLETIVSTSNSVLPLVSSITIFIVLIFVLDPETASLTTGQFLAFNAAFGVFLSGILQMATTAIQVLNIVPIFERAKPILQAVPEIDERKTDPGLLFGDLEVNQACFRYHEDGPDILKNVSIKAKPGEFIALVGSSGSGKSTLLRLLLGFEQLMSGAIYYDAKNLTDLDLRSVRRQIGVVLQSGKLTVGEIYTNIVGSRPLTINDAWDAARMAGLEKDIKAMPMGMHTLVSEGSGTLSGGQRQRLLIARALVNRPKIIFFDEATSALDNPTQAQVSASLDSLQATRVVIAHRLSTIKNADRIYVLDAGRVVEEGDYDSLMKLNGLFAEMAQRQLA